MNKSVAPSDLVAPKVTTGPLPASRKVFAPPDAAPDLRVPLREIVLSEASGEPPLPVYDTSGPYTDASVTIDVEKGFVPRPRGMGARARRRRGAMTAARSSRSITAMSRASISPAPSRPRTSLCAASATSRSHNMSGRAPA